MGFFGSSNTQSAPQANKRRGGRLRFVDVFCYQNKTLVGQVLDLSASGMRVGRKGTVVLRSGQGMAIVLCWRNIRIPLKANVVRVRKTAFWRQDIGFEFTDLTPSQQTALSFLARTAAEPGEIAAAPHRAESSRPI